jgi:hypothetical protein
MTMDQVFIANFGVANSMWPQARDLPAVTVFNDQGADPFWRSGDRAGFIAYCQANSVTQHGKPPTTVTASRWFNLPTIVTESVGDVWIHREQEAIWWSITLDTEAAVSRQPPPAGGREPIVLYAKPCSPWSDRSRTGQRLRWSMLHPKARTFLFTEQTLQQINEGNAAYAMALINGENLERWHSLPDWRAAVAKSGKGAVFEAPARRIAILNMVMNAENTARNSNGQVVERIAKDKRYGLGTREEAEALLDRLMASNEDRCALTAVALQFGRDSEPDLRPSLDRIDSAGHYEPNNVQVVAWFANRWKNANDDAGFRQLIALVRRTDPAPARTPGGTLEFRNVTRTDRV